ncbi:MAG: aldehyde reductase [Sphingobacterium sp.]|jgi:dihydroflavonol-4-reductase|nr:aldehyde reductase [Sphingobacterium sp.]
MNNQTVLVTGGTGFLGVNIILELLKKGFTVRTTLRTLSRKNEILDALTAGGISTFDQLSFYEADLLSDNGWDEAAQGCDYVLHVASPFVAEQPKDENELIIPARDGTLRALRAAKKAGVKRVVLTSSFAAIGYSIDPRNHVFTELDWTDENAPVQAYIKSKTIAEKAAWQFMEDEAPAMELTVINPVGIFGPILGGISSASLDTVVKGIVEGHIKENAPFTFGAVDVRDVADIHIKAMLHPEAAGQRFLATSEGAMSFYDVAELIKKERPKLAGKIATMQPTPVEEYTQMSNKKAAETLGWEPRTREEAILASVDSYNFSNPQN